MKLGIDIGSSFLKNNLGLIIPSKIRQGTSFNKDAIQVVFDGVNLVIGEGHSDVEINKASRETNLIYLYTMIALASNDLNNEVAIGLPLGQYKANKDAYREYIMANNEKTFVINGEVRKIRITNVKIFPEGLASVPPGVDTVICDIGGRTTDICLLKDRKVINPITKPRGILNLYAEIVNAANEKYSLDLTENDGERVLKGLKIDGITVCNQFARDIMAEFVDDIINTLKLNYSLKTNDLLLTGGGSILCEKAFKKRAAQTVRLQNSVFSNAEAYFRGL